MSHVTISRLIAALVVISAILVPAASARPIDSPIGVAQATHAQTRTGIPPAESAPSSGTSAASSGFDWGDAAIGAAGTLIVLSAGAAGVVTFRRSRGRSHTLVTG
jgi:hypothetical protein